MSPWFQRASEVIPAIPGGDARQTLRHAPRAVSAIPIAVGVVIMFVGVWLLSAAINNPFVIPSRAPGVELGRFDDRTVPFPAGLDGTVDVFVEDSGAYPPRERFRVRDEDGLEVEPVAVTELQDFEGPNSDLYWMAVAVDVEPNGDYTVLVPGEWIGRVAFVHDDNPPADPDWRHIGEAVSVITVGAGIAIVWTIRRMRWRSALTRYKADLEDAGYVVD